MTYVLFDYGVGNLHSLRKALEAQGVETQTTRNIGVLADSDVAVLPGVGAFGHVMKSLDGARGMLRQRHRDGRPILGICIGMQVLYGGSEEAPGVQGLNVLGGTVRRIPPGAGKVPHMGWNTIESDGDLAEWNGRHVYYVHSYAVPAGKEATATTEYGMRFTAAVRSKNTWGFQFHPEKSSDVGEEILAQTVAQIKEAL